MSEAFSFWNDDWVLDSTHFESHLKILPDEPGLGQYTDMGDVLGPVNSPLPREIWLELESLVDAWPQAWSMSDEEFLASQSEFDRLDEIAFRLAEQISELTGINTTYRSANPLRIEQDATAKLLGKRWNAR